jgi:HK97 family phage prohead protease
MTLALAGYVTRWHKPIEYDHRRVMLMPSAFNRTLRSGSVVKLLLNHIDSECVGSTDDNLQIHSDRHGLAFRFKITDSESALRVKSMAASRNNTCTSVGFDWQGAETITRLVDGVETVCITDTTLFECSFLHGYHAGRIEQAYATLLDLDYSKSLQDNCSGGMFLREGAAIGVTRALQDLADKPRVDAQRRWLESLPRNHDWL